MSYCKYKNLVNLHYQIQEDKATLLNLAPVKSQSNVIGKTVLSNLDLVRLHLTKFCKKQELVKLSPVIFLFEIFISNPRL